MDMPDRTNKTYKTPPLGTRGAGAKKFLSVRSRPPPGASQQ